VRRTVAYVPRTVAYVPRVVAYVPQHVRLRRLALLFALLLALLLALLALFLALLALLALVSAFSILLSPRPAQRLDSPTARRGRSLLNNMFNNFCRCCLQHVLHLLRLPRVAQGLIET
jgi:hypothetical protein